MAFYLRQPKQMLQPEETITCEVSLSVCNHFNKVPNSNIDMPPIFKNSANPLV